VEKIAIVLTEKKMIGILICPHVKISEFVFYILLIIRCLNRPTFCVICALNRDMDKMPILTNGKHVSNEHE